MKTKISSILLLTALLLSACGAGSAASTTDASTTVVTAKQPADGVNVPDDLDLQTVLAAGTLNLDDTDYAVTPEQAAELLVLWKTVSSLSQADNATTDEIDATYAQIQETLTADQLAAIDAMNLSADSMADLFGGFGGPGNVSDEARATRQAQFESGDFTPPEGFTPGQGGGFGGGDGQGFSGDFTPGQGSSGRSGSGSDQSGTRGQSGLSFGLVNRVIMFLEQRAAE